MREHTRTSIIVGSPRIFCYSHIFLHWIFDISCISHMSTRITYIYIYYLCMYVYIGVFGYRYNHTWYTLTNIPLHIMWLQLASYIYIYMCIPHIYIYIFNTIYIYIYICIPHIYIYICRIQRVWYINMNFHMKYMVDMVLNIYIYIYR